MRFIIAGGSGFIGKELTDFLLTEGHEVVILTRSKTHTNDKKINYIQWLGEGAFPEKEIGHADVFINLAGVSINSGRWTAKHQKQIYDSRMEATDELLRIMAAMQKKPSVLVNASAIGLYPSSLTAVYTETSPERAQDFLGQTVHDWEKKAASANEYGIRTVFMRFGVVLGKKGGALPLMTLPYKLFMGGTVGTGKQWVSWVHLKDAVRAICFAAENNKLSGPINVSAPRPVNMEEFCKTLGAVLHSPHYLRVPGLLLKLVLGKKSSLILEGQHVLPEKLTEANFQFLFPYLQAALRDLLVDKEN
jgi:uncharacterized protein (TIGR01777 family)